MFVVYLVPGFSIIPPPAWVSQMGVTGDYIQYIGSTVHTKTYVFPYYF